MIDTTRAFKSGEMFRLPDGRLVAARIILYPVFDGDDDMAQTDAKMRSSLLEGAEAFDYEVLEDGQMLKTIHSPLSERATPVPVPADFAVEDLEAEDAV